MDDHKMVGKGGHGKYLWRRIGQPPVPGKRDRGCNGEKLKTRRARRRPPTRAS